MAASFAEDAVDAGRGVPGALTPGGFIDLCVPVLELGGKYFAGSGSSGSLPGTVKSAAPPMSSIHAAINAIIPLHTVLFDLLHGACSVCVYILSDDSFQQ